MDTDPTQSITPQPTHRDGRTRDGRTPPAEVPGYDLQRLLGTGAYGEVWVAADRNTGRQVAIKFFAHRGGIDWGLISREVEKLVFLSADRYVVQLLEVGWQADPPFFVMEYVENGSLDELLRVRGTLGGPQALELFRELAVGLSRAHGKGVLHCDLKPANILLDQDHQPRLADFGQSRLVSEQSPALGTLFYMAPEQADVHAVPDAQWDVYALGAILYCMLTGAPPYRTVAAAKELDSTRNLPARLHAYRKLIMSAPLPTAHRGLPGMDRALAEIIDRCLAKSPADRFEHMPAILESLRQREYQRTRRPLLLLGIVGPLLLVLTMGIFGFRGYKRAILDSESLVEVRAKDGNKFAADLVAENVAHSIEQRMRAVGQVAAEARLIEAVREVQQDSATREYLSLLAPAHAADPVAPGVFVDSPARGSIQQFVQRQLDDPSAPWSASWFVTDAHGTFLAAAFHGVLEESPIGRNFAYRSYFHGGPHDLPKGTRPRSQLEDPQLSAVFRSTSTATWKIAISAPIHDGDEFLGVIAMTAELGDFHDFPPSVDRFAVVVDGREGPHRGVILEHPMLDDVAAKFDFSQLKSDVALLRDQEQLVYRDPIAKAPMGKKYRGEWLAGTSRVVIDQVHDNIWEKRDTGLIVVVQERRAAAVMPVGQLGERMVREGLLALTFVVTVSGVLWYLVGRSLWETRRAARHISADNALSSTLHSRETLVQPAERPPGSAQ